MLRTGQFSSSVPVGTLRSRKLFLQLHTLNKNRFSKYVEYARSRPCVLLRVAKPSSSSGDTPSGTHQRHDFATMSFDDTDEVPVPKATAVQQLLNGIEDENDHLSTTIHEQAKQAAELQRTLREATESAQRAAEHAVSQLPKAASDAVHQIPKAASDAIQQVPVAAAEAKRIAEERVQKLPAEVAQAAHDFIAPDLGPEAQRHNIREALRDAHRQVLIFLGAGAVVIGSVWVWVAGTPHTTDKPYNFTVNFPAAYGIRKGTPVRMKGVTVGAVQDVQVDLHRVSADVQIFHEHTRIPKSKATRMDFNRTGPVTPECFIDILIPPLPDKATAAVLAATQAAGVSTHDTPGNTPPPATKPLDTVGAKTVADFLPTSIQRQQSRADSQQLQSTSLAGTAGEPSENESRLSGTSNEKAPGNVQPGHEIGGLGAVLDVGAALTSTDLEPPLKRILVEVVRQQRHVQQLKVHDEVVGHQHDNEEHHNHDRPVSDRNYDTQQRIDKSRTEGGARLDGELPQILSAGIPEVSAAACDDAKGQQSITESIEGKKDAHVPALSDGNGIRAIQREHESNATKAASMKLPSALDLERDLQGQSRSASEHATSETTASVMAMLDQAAGLLRALSRPVPSPSGKPATPVTPPSMYLDVTAREEAEKEAAAKLIGPLTHFDLQHAASPTDVDACHAQGLIICAGDVVQGHIGASMDELTRRMVLGNRGPGRVQGIKGIHH